jgi:ribosomal protein S18 acetylase RimI-like enzyme
MDYEWILRTTVAEDEPFLWKMLFYASHSNDEEGLAPSDIKGDSVLAGYVEDWRIAGCPGVIAEVAGEAVGAAWLRLLGDSAQSDPVFVGPEIPELAAAVLPGYEGRGIGTAMIEALLIDASDRYEAVVLSVRAGNPAVRLYERLGFQRVGEITNRVGGRSVKMIVEF